MSSDESDSDDELLGGGPTFGRAQSRKEKASEKKQMSFLDNCVEKVTQRSERNERLATMIREEKEQQEATEEQDLDDGAAEANSEDGDENTSKEAGASSGAVSAGLGSRSRSSSSLPSVKRRFDIDDPEFEKRLDEMTRDSGNNAEGRAKRRRQIDDAVDGLDELSSDEEGGVGGSSSEDHKRRKALASARATGMSTCLGTRRMFLAADSPSAAASTDVANHDSENLDPRNVGSMSIFPSISDARKELKTIVDSLTKSAGKKGTAEQKKVERDVRDKILKPLKDVGESGSVVLSEYLSQAALVRLCSDASLPVPRELMVSLFRVSCSGRNVSQLSLGAYKTLTEIMKAQLQIVEFGADREGTDSIKIAHLSELFPGLERLYRLWTQNGPSPAMNKITSDEMEEAKKQRRPRQSYLDNVSGLGHFFALWATALDYDYISASAKIKSEIDEDPKPAAWDDDVSKTSTRALAALSKASLDPIFHSGRKDLINALNWLIVSLVEYNARRLGGGTSGASNEVCKFFSAVAKAVCDACSNLSGGLPKSADEDDVNGWLPLSLAVRMLPIDHSYNTPSIDAIRLKAAVAEFVLKKCLNYTDGWEARVSSEFKAYSKSLDDKELSKRWRMVVCSEVALRKIQSSGDYIASDGPRYLACVEIVGICAELGMAQFSDVEPSTDGTGGIYGSTDEANAISQSLESLEKLCSKLKSSVTNVFAYPHLRRVKEVLTLLGAFFRHQKVEASEMALHRGEVNMKQKTLAGWFTSGESQSQQKPSGGSQEDETPMPTSEE